MMKHAISFACAAALAGLAALLPAQAQTPQQKMKDCAAEWKTMKTSNQTKGMKYRDFEKECLAKSAGTTPAATPTAPSAPAATNAPATRSAPPAGKSAAIRPSGSGEFQTEAAAKARCPTDTVVWVNLNSKIYHYSGHSDYGKTKSGAYMCEKDTNAAGFRAAKNEKRS